VRGLRPDETFARELRCSKHPRRGQGVPRAACLRAEAKGCLTGRFSQRQQRNTVWCEAADPARARQGNRRRKAPLSAEKKSGRPAKLTDEQWDVVAGAILLEKKNRSGMRRYVHGLWKSE
jgi:hypothetical protein